MKDPSVVHHDGRWHLFCTLRSVGRSHQIEYIRFESWNDTRAATRELLNCREGYFCAPQVFYFRPHQRWYLLYQLHEEGRRLGLQPGLSWTTDIEDAASWSAPTLLFPDDDPDVQRWIDFWIICDDEHACLFFTSLDGSFWRMSCPLPDFPRGFGNPTRVLSENNDRWRLFEASHTYRLKGSDRFLTIVEAQDKTRGNRRFQLAYVADALNGEWRPLASSLDNPFASADNVESDGDPWATYISHGELLRDGVDETLTVDPANLRWLYQGAVEEQVRGQPYGEIPWRLGLLTSTT